jgi:hypothetical protein
MTERSVAMCRFNRPRSYSFLSVLALLMVCRVLPAEELGGRSPSYEPRVPVAKNLSAVGEMLVNERPGQPWRVVAKEETLHSRDLLMALPGLSAQLETAPRAVRLTLWGNLPDLSEFSGLQSAVILHDSRSFDLDFTLQRGRVVLSNCKESGPARVWLRVNGAAFAITLAEPGATICLGLYSFWPRGSSFSITPREEDSPVRRLSFFAVKGQMDVKDGSTQHSLSEPPGRASLTWDSVNGTEEAARTRPQVDGWADIHRKRTPQARLSAEVAETYLLGVKTKQPRTVLFEMVDAASKNSDHSKAMADFGVLGLAAMNDIERVAQTLDDPRQAELRRAATLALRHWIGDAPGRDQRLYRYLAEQLGYSKAQAATFMQLLHGTLSPDDPETYEALIAYLKHEKLAIRELAWARLSNLVPKDLAIAYDPAATPAERAKAYAAWKEAIPSGSLPKRKLKK